MTPEAGAESSLRFRGNIPQNSLCLPTPQNIWAVIEKYCREGGGRFLSEGTTVEYQNEMHRRGGGGLYLHSI